MSTNTADTQSLAHGDSFIESLNAFKLGTQEKKLVVGGLALAGFALTLYRVRNGAGKIKFPGDVNPSLSGDEKAVHMKVATYMFATKALMTASTLVGCAGLAATMGVSYYMNVNSLKDFAIEMTRITQRTFPSLVIMSQKDSTDGSGSSDTASLSDEEKELKAIVSEWSAAIQEAEDAPPNETVEYFKKQLRNKFFG